LQQKILINNAIRASELYVIDQNGKTLGVLSKDDALALAKNSQLDLIEVSPSAVPPVAKIMDYGKFTYDLSKKAKEVKAKAHTTETKNIQISIGIGEHDIDIKAKQGAEWIKEGHRVKIEMQLKGRNKYMEESFLRERLDRILAIIPVEYKIAEPLKKMPKGMSVVLEKSK
jgi:translation initiation factor IF-3